MKTKQVNSKKTKASTAKKTTSSKRSKKVKEIPEMEVLDGKVNEQDEKSKLRDLESLLNPAASYNPFKANSGEELEAKMGDMSLPELQSLAVETGVFPSGNRTTLKNKLKKEFKNRVFLGKGRVMNHTKPIADVDSMTPEQKDLFSKL
jgi:hypothetical protein